MQQPDLRSFVRVFGRIGLTSFGGPAAQIALMHKELVDDRPWMSEPGFLRGLSFCMLLPGPEAMQLATYAGWRLRGVTGGLLAGLLFVLPGALVIALLVGLYMAFGQLPYVQAAFLGIKAAVVVIVVMALRKLATKALNGAFSWSLAALGFIALFLFQLPFPLVVLAAGLFGFLRGGTAPSDTPAPARVDLTSGLRTLLIWGSLWLVPLVLLGAFGQEFLADMGWFFAKLAVVTFGGAYAVLSYMTQTVVDQYGWITTTQMIDALGLAETTPGPLILVTQFVAMLAGGLQGGLGLALAAGAVALWATFVPCFLWIFLAAPYVEQISAHPRLGGALKAITATVVGVILNLSVWFALHVVFAQVASQPFGPAALPLPDVTSLDISALILVALAAAVQWRVKGNMPQLLALLAAAGIALRFFLG